MIHLRFELVEFEFILSWFGSYKAKRIATSLADRQITFKVRPVNLGASLLIVTMLKWTCETLILSNVFRFTIYRQNVTGSPIDGE